MRIDRGPWMIVGVYPQGCDDQGRPGALAFHGLFINHWTYARSGADPFAFSDLLRRDWSPADQDAILSNIPRTIRRARFRRTGGLVWSDDDMQFKSIVDALVQRRKVLVQSDRPIESLARLVWRTLPWQVRLRATVATWAFDNMNRFDLAAFPKLAGIRREPTDLIVGPADPHR